MAKCPTCGNCRCECHCPRERLRPDVISPERRRQMQATLRATQPLVVKL